MSDEQPEIYIVFDDARPIVAYHDMPTALQHAAHCRKKIGGSHFHVRRLKLRDALPSAEPTVSEQPKDPPPLYGMDTDPNILVRRLERLACAAATLPLGTLFADDRLHNVSAYNVAIAAVRYFQGHPSALDAVAERWPGPDIGPGRRRLCPVHEYVSDVQRDELGRLHRVIESVSRDLVAAEKREDENFKRWQTAVDQHAVERMRRQIMQQRLLRLADNPDTTLFTVEQLRDIADEKEPTR